MNHPQHVLVDRPEGRSTAELLAEIDAEVRWRRASELREFEAVVAWADANTVTDPAGAATVRDSYVDTGVPIAGPGAPLVSEFGLMELVATLRRSPDAGRDHVGKVVEAAWRLPRITAALRGGRVELWRVLRVADLTRTLPEAAAAFVDRQLGFVVGSCTWTQIERLVAEALVRFDPDRAEQRRRDAADRRRLDVLLDQAGPDGVVPLDGGLDLADALDLDAAVTAKAGELARLGNPESLDVRRSLALGEIARAQLTLDLTGGATRPPRARPRPGRTVILYVHLGQAAIDGPAAPGAPVGRLDNTRTPVTAGQVRDWCGRPGARVVVKPVIDLADHYPLDAYEIPDRLRERVVLRDRHCAFPYCTRPAESCDLDHATPHAHGGATCPCNLVASCRRHHRAKTHSLWRYTIIEPGTYLWLSPHDRHWLVDHRGTHALDPPRRLDHTPDPGETDLPDPRPPGPRPPHR